MTSSTTGTARPTFTVSAAARATGRSRRTLTRMLDAGELDGAHRDDAGAWVIPADSLLAAGLHLHAPSPPDDPPAPAASTPPPPSADLDSIRGELAEWRRRAEVAEAVAAERAEALADVRAALALAQRMLPPGPDTTTPSAPTADMAEPRHTPEVQQSTGRLARWWRNRR